MFSIILQINTSRYSQKNSWNMRMKSKTLNEWIKDRWITRMGNNKCYQVARFGREKKILKSGQEWQYRGFYDDTNYQARVAEFGQKTPRTMGSSDVWKTNNSIPAPSKMDNTCQRHWRSSYWGNLDMTHRARVFGERLNESTRAIRAVS